MSVCDAPRLQDGEINTASLKREELHLLVTLVVEKSAQIVNSQGLENQSLFSGLTQYRCQYRGCWHHQMQA